MTDPAARAGEDREVFAAYATKDVAFRFRGLDFSFALSHGLFSSADIDSGSRLLLATVTRLLDEDLASGAALPRRVLDAGSGIGVLGVAIGRALIEAGVDDPRVLCCDRDELARVFTAGNAARAGLEAPTLTARAEPLAAALRRPETRARDGEERRAPAAIEPLRLVAHTEPLAASLRRHYAGESQDLDSVRPAPAAPDTPLTTAAHEGDSRSEDREWDLILSNLPAKAGAPVLADFLAAAAARLSARGRCAVVIVDPLAEAARRWIAETGATHILENPGREHRVFVFGPPGKPPKEAEGSRDRAASMAGRAGADDLGPRDRGSSADVYARNSQEFELLDQRYRLRTIHGAAGFDQRGKDINLAARLLVRIAPDLAGTGKSPRTEGSPRSAGSPVHPGFPAEPRDSDRGPYVLVFGEDQGHFACWLAERRRDLGLPGPDYLLGGRNVLALEAAAANLRDQAKVRSDGPPVPRTYSPLPATDLAALAAKIRDGRSTRSLDLIALFPEPVPRVDRGAQEWAAAAELLRPGAVLVVALPSTPAERFDRKRHGPFSRLGDLKRDGFRALAYRRLDR